MTPLIIIQARLGSTRLPGKVLMPIKGKPMIQYLCERVDEVTMSDAIELALPYVDGFSALGDWCRSHFGNEGTDMGQDDEDDVAGRFCSTLEDHPERDTFVRLCGDSPLMDPALIDAAIALYEPPYLEIRSPVGCVEVCDTAEFLAGLPMMTPHEREHVTLRLRPSGKTISVGNGPRLVVDTAEDFQRVAAVIEKMDRPHTEYGWRECVSLL
jgi:spore coat polysaccharide biosynthesis protein SpsF (cytidylyltransferase family)